MMNIEKYYKEILKNKDSFAVNEQTGKVSRCSKIICGNCKFYYANTNSCYEYDNCEEAKLSWLFEENEESNSILTEEERKYLSTVFEPFKERIKYVQKEIEIYSGYDTTDGEEDEPVTNMAIYIHFLNNTFSGLPFFDEKMFANMENYKDYTLEDLGL